MIQNLNEVHPEIKVVILSGHSNFGYAQQAIQYNMCGIIDYTRDTAYKAVNSLLVQRNWLIGYRIAEEEFQNADRAEHYGADFPDNVWKIFCAVIMVTLCGIVTGK